jgi:hypothetical protein
MRDNTELDAKIAALGLEYKAEFVPQRLSRNSGEKNPSLNWRVTLAKGRAVVSTDYMQGIGHVPGYIHYISPKDPVEKRRAQHRQNEAANEGTYPHIRSTDTKRFGMSYTGRGWVAADARKLPAPLLRDILYSLVLDSDVDNYAGFEDWASNFRYEEDSRKAERIYRACCDTARKLQALLGRATIEELREAFQDY